MQRGEEEEHAQQPALFLKDLHEGTNDDPPAPLLKGVKIRLLHGPPDTPSSSNP